MRTIQKTILGLLMAAVAAIISADQGSLRIKVFPELAAADGRTLIDVNVEVRDDDGKLVPDGTEVLLQTTHGVLRETSVLTESGFARTVWQAGSIPGLARITATALILRTTATFDFELLPAGTLEGRDKDYVELVAPNGLRYSLDYQTVAASASNRGVVVRVGSIEIKADDVQIDVEHSVLKARKAEVTNHGDPRSFEELFLKIDTRSGLGTTVFPQPTLQSVLPQGRWLRFELETRDRLSLVEISASGRLSLARQQAAGTLFQFTDLSDTVSFVKSKKVILVPKKRIQFHRADMELDGRKALSLPLYEQDLTTGAPKTFGEQILTFNDDRIGVNYPYYLSLKPGETSLLRLRAGETYGRGVGASAGFFVDYELKWDQGDIGEGGLTVSGLNTSGWSIDARQNYRLRDGSNLNGYVSMPGRESIYGSLNYTKPVGSMNLSLRGNLSRALEGDGADSERLSASLESRPLRMGELPLTLYYGLNASMSETRTELARSSTDASGLRLRGTFDTWRIDPSTSLAASFSANQVWGSNQGLALTGSAALTRRLGSSGSLRLNYEFSQYSEAINGAEQRLSLMADYRVGRLDLNIFASKSLSEDWNSLYADASYRISDLYRVYGSYTLDQYVGDEILDYSLTFAYRLGMREIGVNWSKKTGRFGLEILGSRF